MQSKNNGDKVFFCGTSLVLNLKWWYGSKYHYIFTICTHFFPLIFECYCRKWGERTYRTHILYDNITWKGGTFCFTSILLIWKLNFFWKSKKISWQKKRKAHKKNWSGIWNFLLAFIFLFLHFAAQFMAPKKSHCVLDDWIRDSLSSTIHTYHKCRALEKHHSYYSSSCFFDKYHRFLNFLWHSFMCFLALKLMVVSKEKSLLIECLGRPWRKAMKEGPRKF